METGTLISDTGGEENNAMKTVTLTDEEGE